LIGEAEQIAGPRMCRRSITEHGEQGMIEARQVS